MKNNLIVLLLMIISFSGCGISEKLQNVGINENELRTWSYYGFNSQQLKLSEDEVDDLIIGYRKANIPAEVAEKYYKENAQFRPNNPKLAELFELHKLIWREEQGSMRDIFDMVLWFESKENYLTILNPKYGKDRNGWGLFYSARNTSIDKALKVLTPYFDTNLFTSNKIQDNIEKILKFKKNNITPEELLMLKTILGNDETITSRLSQDKLINVYNELKKQDFNEDDFKKYFYFKQFTNETEIVNEVMSLKKYGITYKEYEEYHLKWSKNFEDEIKFIFGVKELKVTPENLHKWEDAMGSEIYNNLESLKMWINLGYDVKKAKDNFYGYEPDTIKTVDQLLKLNITKSVIKKGIKAKLSINEILKLQKAFDEKVQQVSELIKSKCNGKTPIDYDVLSAPLISPYQLKGKCVYISDLAMTQAVDEHSGLYNLTFFGATQSYVIMKFNKIAPMFVGKSLVKAIDVTELNDNSKVPVMEFLSKLNYEEE